MKWSDIKDSLRPILSLTDYIDIEAANANIRANVPFRGPNVYILFAAIIIASLGLNVNSIPVIIGAMLISPLMSPIIGFGLGLGTNDKQLLLSSLKNLGIMVGISLLASTLYFILSPLDMDNPTELLARTNPSIYDVLIALFGGLAGVLEIARKDKGTVMSGVAIATALMPPLCTVGYGIANLNIHYVGGALYLFFINSVFIAMAAFLTARFLKFPMVQDKDGKQRTRAISYTLLIVVVIVPSIYSAYTMIGENNFTKSARHFAKAGQAVGKTYIYDYSIDTHSHPYTITLRLAGESLNDDTREMLYREAEHYGLMRSQVIFYEDATMQYDRLNETELVRDLMSTNEQRLQLRDDSIRVLGERIARYEALVLPTEQVAAELRAQWPTIKQITLARGESIDETLTNSEEVILLVHTSSPLTPDETSRIQAWLSVRLQATNVRVIEVKQ